MTEAPVTQYTRSADGTNLAYQVSGEGPIDLVFMHFAHPIDLLADDPGFVRVRRRPGTFSRTVWSDLRGMGASEGDPRESLAGKTSDDDLTAVLDAVGFARPALVAEGASGLRAIHFSVTHPERVNVLVLVNCFAHYVREDDYPWGLPAESLDGFVAAVKARWSTATTLEVLAPSRVTDDRFRAWYARSTRFSSGPDRIAALARASYEIDLRPLLPSISCPTLVLRREGDRLTRLGAGRYLAEHIPDARFAVLPGDDHCSTWATPTPWSTRSRSS
jgi:pimeloyl-ACP methyl ester carboxylesterase